MVDLASAGEVCAPNKRVAWRLGDLGCELVVVRRAHVG
jgi:hypothetical protein